MALTPNPKPAQIREAILDWVPANKITWDSGWDNRGRPWTYGLRGVVEHHLSGVDEGAIQWSSGRSEGSDYPYCNEVMRSDGTIIIWSTLSVWHSGKGGPWPRYGVPQDLGHLMLWGREFASWGEEKDFTDAMFETQAQMDCALRQVAGWSSFDRLINHKGWTDGGAEMGLDYYLPTRGRKNDTLYDIGTFRRNARNLWLTKHPIDPPKPPDPPKPNGLVDLSEIKKIARTNGSSVDVMEVTKALRKVGITRGITVQEKWDDSVTIGYKQWQKKLGFPKDKISGIPGIVSLKTLGQKSGLFKVVL